MGFTGGTDIDKKYCKNCDRIIQGSWCRPCQLNNLRKNFTTWMSGNEKIDNFIKKVQRRVNYPSDIVFEWIPYCQFNNIKEIEKNDFSISYLANWKDGPLEYNISTMIYKRRPNEGIILKCLYNTQNKTNKLLIEV